MTEMRFYNGFTEHEMANAYGLQKLGIEKCRPFFTRGIVVDVAGLKGRMLNMGEEITVADVQAALQRAGHRGVEHPRRATGCSSIPGGAVSGRRTMPSSTRASPGSGWRSRAGASAKQLALVGADTWATEVVPNPNPDLVFAVHNELITKNGIFNHENLDF